ncbi:tetratricopeptide repeat-containing sensor histidine kinase [Lacinutrix neustonica]|uniref:histidine kinase n=1 Tax=Lacinutrix neustonica TaxID=2980107 RepID=A0A9E8MYJ1_9FLAO|nr:tetratricopeptide repeat-containing sensor histidine kinase [Lacinutrix neustonica]WAC03250.1 tetratricopeptide repeat-containing sensor histidine kinase [Lacinutrix neustonica]
MITYSLKLKQESGDIRGYGFALYGRAKVYLFTKEYKKAEQDFIKAIEIHQETVENMGASMSLSKLGKLYCELGDYTKAEKTVKQSLKLTVTYNISLIKIKNYHLLYLIFKGANNIKESLFYLECYLKEKESVMTTQALRIIENYDLINRMNILENEAKIQREKQKAIDKKNRDQKHILKQKQDFLSIMSHEIRTPLNAITTIVSLLKNKIRGEDKKLFDSLQFASNNLIIIVNDILDFTKLDSNKSVIEENNINFSALCANILNLYGNAANNKGINLILKNGIPEEQHYLIDQPKMAQILGNLISNAIKFTRDGDVIFHTQLIAQDDIHDKIKFIIKDTGEGISKQDLEVIFDSFSQIKPITTRRTGGHGFRPGHSKEIGILIWREN